MEYKTLQTVKQHYVVFVFESIIFQLAQWYSWLARRPVTAEVEGSSPFWVVFNTYSQY